MKWQSKRERERETLTVWLKNYKNVYGTLLSASDSTPTGDSRCILRTKIARAFSKPQSPVWLWTQFPGVGVHRVFIGPLGNKAVFARHWSVATMSTSQEELGWICEVFGKWNSNSGTYFVASKQDILEGSCKFVCFDLFYIHLLLFLYKLFSIYSYQFKRILHLEIEVFCFAFLGTLTCLKNSSSSEVVQRWCMFQFLAGWLMSAVCSNRDKALGLSILQRTEMFSPSELL